MKENVWKIRKEILILKEEYWKMHNKNPDQIMKGIARGLELAIEIIDKER